MTEQLGPENVLEIMILKHTKCRLIFHLYQHFILNLNHNCDIQSSILLQVTDNETSLSDL